MACRGFWECLLKLLNFVLGISGLSMIGYGVYLLMEWYKVSGGDLNDQRSSGSEVLMLGRPILAAVSLSDSILDKLPRAWFIYLFIAVGVIIVVISLFGCIGAGTGNGCCLSCYSFFILLLILAELGAAAFIFFDHSWKDLIPVDKTGNFDVIYNFLEKNWEIGKWVALAVVVLEALIFLLALIVRAVNTRADYDSDDEYIRQPLVSRQGVTATGIPVSANPDQLPGRADAWSQRMREKYGLNTSEFTYNPADQSRYQQAAAPPAEERRTCIVM